MRSDPAMQIYVHRNQQRLGPFTETEIRAQLSSSAISPRDLVWWPGQTTWAPLGKSLLGAQVPAQNNPPPHSPMAAWSLACGLAGFFCLPLLSLAAILLGHLGRSEARRNPAIPGSGLALAGIVLGYLQICLFFLLFAGAIVYLYEKRTGDDFEQSIVVDTPPTTDGGTDSPSPITP